MSRLGGRPRHRFSMQALPIIAKKITCERCGLVKKIDDPLTGKRSKCSPGHRYVYLGNGGTGRRFRSDGRVKIMSRGHADFSKYRQAKR